MNQTAHFQVFNASAGSGKTFRLVAEYVKILFSSESTYAFQKILAITFTNKAASEMKDRILTTLKDAAEGHENAIVNLVKEELNFPDSFMQSRGKIVLENILHNYANFNVATIDSFTHQLIRTFAFDLGLSLDFEVEMDTDSLFAEVVDVLLSQIGEDEALTKTLIAYTIEQVGNDKSWDISKSLHEVAKLLISDDDRIYVNQLMELSPADFTMLQKKLQKYLLEVDVEMNKIGTEALNLIASRGIAHTSFSYQDLPKHFIKLTHKIWSHPTSGVKFSGRLAKSVEIATFYGKSKATVEVEQDRASIDEISEELIAYYQQSEDLYRQHYKDYSLSQQVLKNIVPFSVLNYLYQELKKIKEEQNILFNAEFNNIISEEIKNEPAPYIYERLGNRYQYFFIDEMQDTSELQWENLLPLIGDALAQEEAQLILVGDAKQSIYRWRGGKASQFIKLSNPEDNSYLPFEKSIQTLGTNYRSYDEVIHFNNHFFAFVADRMLSSEYAEIFRKEKDQQTNTKKGGYVQVSLLEQEGLEDKNEAICEEVYEKIQKALESGFSKEEICVLTRKKAHGLLIADFLLEKGISVISPDSLLLKNNTTVKALVQFIRWIENEKDKEALLDVLLFLFEIYELKEEKHAFLQQGKEQENVEALADLFQKDFSISQFYALTLYDAVEYLLRSFDLLNIADVFVQSFLDEVLNYQLKNSGHVSTFLNYWDLKKDKLNVELSIEGSNAIQIMTVHKSKGLEFPVVIFPFDLETQRVKEKVWIPTENKQLFDVLPITQVNASANLAAFSSYGEAIYEKQLQETQLDNFNLLYVALTRAEEQLYIISNYKAPKSGEGKNFSHLYKAYIDDLVGGDVLAYESGDAKRLSISKESSEAFALEKMTSTDKSDNNIKLVFGNDSEAQDYGNLLHKAMQLVFSIHDEEKAKTYIENQFLETSTKQQAIKDIKAIISHSEIAPYFTEGLDVLNERNIINHQGDTIIPDRLVFNANRVVILDYKTGTQETAHEKQIKYYGEALGKMGYEVIKKLLIYVDDGIEVVEV